MFVYRILESITLEDGMEYSKGDIVSCETLENIMLEYYEVKVAVIRVL